MCEPICDLCYVSKASQSPIEYLQKVYGKLLKFRIVGAYRGFARSGLGCYEEVVPRDPMDDRPERLELDKLSDNFSASEDNVSLDSDDGEVEVSHKRYLKTTDRFVRYDYHDVDQGFSDHSEQGDDYDPDSISPEELQDIIMDEKLYREVVGEGEYIDMQDEWVHPGYYSVRMTL